MRVLGDADDALDTIRAVDEIYINIKDAGLYDKIWQAFAVFLPIKSVGVQGDQTNALARRGPSSHHLLRRHDRGLVPVRAEVSAAGDAKICNQVKNVNRVVYDITSKPPSTVEWGGGLGRGLTVFLGGERRMSRWWGVISAEISR